MNQAEFNQVMIEVTKELDKVTMSWDIEVEEWYGWAMESLKNKTTPQLGVQMNGYKMLLQREVGGIKYSIIAVLIKAIESCTAAQLGVDVYKYADIMDLNTKMLAYWDTVAAPIRDRIIRKNEIANAGKGSINMKGLHKA